MVEGTRSSAPEIVVLADTEAVAAEAARRIVPALADAIDARGEAHLALTGGSSAIALYRELADARWLAAVDWTRVHLWWGDDRFVPVDHPDSNIGMAYNMLLKAGARTGESGVGAQTSDIVDGTSPALPIRPENIHPFEIDEALSESDPAELVAERYAEKLTQLLPRGAGGLPAFDVLLLGVGGDGHIMSVFPDSDVARAAAEGDRDAPLVASLPAPDHIEPHLPRVTLSPRLLPAAGLVLVMTSGDDKADVLGRVFWAEHDPVRLPAQLALLPNAIWLLDSAAAAELPRQG
ncbi:MAG TPA: 6-phosphogluconolactonase [Candidatus Limnocylindria bacterium]|nr:6-phosphogluconolactonase [Candidatus Limnocylindria bacterium]